MLYNNPAVYNAVGVAYGGSGSGTVTPNRTLQYHMNRLAGTLNSFDVPTLDAQGAANKWVGTSGLAIVGALNKQAGTSGLELQGVLNKLAGTSGLGENEASSRIF